MKTHTDYFKDVREIGIPLWQAGAYFTFAWSNIVMIYSKEIINLIVR